MALRLITLLFVARLVLQVAQIIKWRAHSPGDDVERRRTARPTGLHRPFHRTRSGHLLRWCILEPGRIRLDAGCAPSSPADRGGDVSAGPPGPRSPELLTWSSSAGIVEGPLCGRLPPGQWDSDDMGRTLYRDGALADGPVPTCGSASACWWTTTASRGSGRRTTSRIRGRTCEVVDASGSTIVPGLVDSHSHLTLPGGAHWIDRGFDPPGATAGGGRAQRAAAALGRACAGPATWGRRSGPTRSTARTRALALGVRDRWAGNREYPYVRAAGAWVTTGGLARPGSASRSSDGDGLVRGGDAAARRRRRPGEAVPRRAGPGHLALHRGRGTRGGRAAHERGARGHRALGDAAGRARRRGGRRWTRIEHGFQLDADAARTMAANSVAMVSTLAVLESWRTFARTTTLPAVRRARRPLTDSRAPRTGARERAAGRPRRRAHRGRHGLRRRLDAGQPAGLGGAVPGRGRASNRGRRWPRPPATAARSCGEPDAGRAARGRARPTSSSSTATRCRIRPRCGGSGSSPERPSPRSPSSSHSPPQRDRRLDQEDRAEQERRCEEPPRVGREPGARGDDATGEEEDSGDDAHPSEPPLRHPPEGDERPRTGEEVCSGLSRSSGRRQRRGRHDLSAADDACAQVSTVPLSATPSTAIWTAKTAATSTAVTVPTTAIAPAAPA